MSSHKVLLPKRELSEFEKHVYDCTSLIGQGAGEVVRIHPEHLHVLKQNANITLL